ncbi:DEAD/DEAH box helicase family protein [Rhodococcus sp. MTM3W5.2]|nr:DEAD/DEAH box helicase family protein [Rhodococcus sp. MTM3W5.2]
MRALADGGITSPFPIQVDTLPDTLAGRDVLGRGKTGSGKTLAFSIPMVARLAGDLAGGKRRPGRPLGLVLAPTRELATQITATLEPLASAYDLRVTTIFGGVSQHRQVQALKAGVDIVVACPGRLEDLMKQKFVSLDAVEITVLDEADHMADLGFLPVVTRILAATPTQGQRLLFSATLDNGVDKLVKRFLHNEVLHSVDEANSPVAAMTHHVFDVHGVEAKKDLVHKLASGTGRRILFMRTKHQARKLARQLTEAGIPRWTCTATCRRPRVTATWPRSPQARPASLSRPTSRPAACTSTTWSWSCTWTRPPSTRRTCTAPAAPRARAAQATS